VATYPVPNAYQALKKGAKNKGSTGSGGSYVFARPNNPSSVLVAWPKVPYEVEVYSPSSTEAASVAASPKLRPVS